MTTYEANFTNSEYQRRVDRTRKTMADRGLEALVGSDPANLYWPSG